MTCSKIGSVLNLLDLMIKMVNLAFQLYDDFKNRKQTNQNLNPPSAMISTQCDPEWLDISIHNVDCSVVIWCRKEVFTY